MEYKAPTAPKKFSVDWSGWLPSGITISSAVHALETGITEDSKSNSTTVTHVTISGGVAGKTYKVETTITRSDAKTYPYNWYIEVKDLVA